MLFGIHRSTATQSLCEGGFTSHSQDHMWWNGEAQPCPWYSSGEVLPREPFTRLSASGPGCKASVSRGTAQQEHTTVTIHSQLTLATHHDGDGQPPLPKDGKLGNIRPPANELPKQGAEDKGKAGQLAEEGA